MKQLLIIGAGGHGRVAADIAKEMGEYTDIFFLDDRIPENIGDCKLVGRVSDVERYIDNSDFFVAIGNNETRKRIMSFLQEAGAQIVTLIHPSAVVASNVSIGTGAVLMPGSVVNNGSRLGNGVIVNTCASVDHDCEIGDYVHISVGAHVAGTVTIGEKTMVGAGATVINNLCICEQCMIGAGAVVVDGIRESGTYVGVPARKID